MNYLKSILLTVVISLWATPLSCLKASAATQITSFSKSVKSAHAKQMHRVFTLLSEERYTDAWKEQLRLENTMAPNHQAYEAALYPLYDLSRAMFMVSPASAGVNMPYDPWTAIQLVRNVYVRGTGIEEANAFLGADDIALSIDLINNLVEKRLIEYVKATGTAEAYRQLLTVLSPDNPAYKYAADQVAVMEFEQSCSTAAGCHSYLRNYPNSPLVDKAKEKLLKLDFAHAKEVNDEKTWKKFIADYQLVSEAATQVAEAKKALTRLQENQLCGKNVPLSALDQYASTHRREAGNRVFVAYDNLINLPTHSYRFMSLKLNFNGCVGTVQETITESTGAVTHNHYKFNEQGLLTEAYNGRTKVITYYTYAHDARHGYYPVSKKEKGKTYVYKCAYTASGRLARITCTDGTTISYTYDADGRLTERTETAEKGTKRKSTYKSGKIRTEKTGETQLTFLRYDGSRATQITSEKGKTKHEWRYTYTIGATGQWTRAHATLDGKPRLTITRTYQK